jgi:hypothetical protein
MQCFATVENRRDVQSCQSKLSPERSSKLTTELAQVMMSMEDSATEQLTRPTLRGQPAKLPGSHRDSEPFEMMKDYGIALCGCEDHDLECGKAATDAYQKAAADWAANNAGTEADTSMEPDSEMEKLVTRVADCSKRVMTPDMGAVDGTIHAGRPRGRASSRLR